MSSTQWDAEETLFSSTALITLIRHCSLRYGIATRYFHPSTGSTGSRHGITRFVLFGTPKLWNSASENIFYKGYIDGFDGYIDGFDGCICGFDGCIDEF